MKMEVRGRHGLEPSVLRQRVEQRVAEYGQKYPQFSIAEHYRWVDESHATASYRGGSAKVALLASEVVVELELPFFARIYKGKIEDFVRKEIARVTAA